MHGKIENGNLLIGKDVIFNVDLPDQNVFVGIRPEGLLVDENGPFVCSLQKIEKLGRDTSVICTHEGMQMDHMRIVVPSETKIENSDTIRFSLKPHKLYLFDESENRIALEEDA